MVEVRLKRLPHGEGLALPKYMTPGAAAMDICAAESGWIPAGAVVMFKTGFAVALHEGYEIQVRTRSGMAKNGIMVANSPGTIDSDYRGEICVLLYNTNHRPMEISRGDRIAQLKVSPVEQATVIEVTELDETVRGAGGFGSTGG